METEEAIQASLRKTVRFLGERVTDGMAASVTFRGVPLDRYAKADLIRIAAFVYEEEKIRQCEEMGREINAMREAAGDAAK